jgi:peptidase M28-like protein
MRTPKTFTALLPLCLLASVLPGSAQLQPAQDDPLARIREAAKSNTQACSATGESLCEQVAPKIIANAQGDSPLAGNLQRWMEIADARKAATHDEAAGATWAVAAFRDAGVEVHTEKFTRAATGRGETSLEPENVIAEIRGREKPDEWVVLGAHLGFSGSGANALEEACNAAMVIEAARDIQLTGVHPRRSIRFVIFAGDTQGMTGSWAFVRAHRSELDLARAALLIDTCARRVNGFALNGRRDIESGVREAVQPINSMGPFEYSYVATVEPENFDFLVEGVPTIFTEAAQNPAARGGPSDSLDKIEIQEVKRNTGIAAVAAFGIAERAAPVGARLSHAEIESLLKDSGLDAQMKAAGLWSLWVSGERGRLP